MTQTYENVDRLTSRLQNDCKVQEDVRVAAKEAALEGTAFSSPSAHLTDTDAATASTTAAAATNANNELSSVKPTTISTSPSAASSASSSPSLSPTLSSSATPSSSPSPVATTASTITKVQSTADPAPVLLNGGYVRGGYANDPTTGYYDEIEICDMDYDESIGEYTYPCPCGDKFRINKEDLLDGEDIARCLSCSLIIKVIYDPEDLEED